MKTDELQVKWETTPEIKKHDNKETLAKIERYIKGHMNQLPLNEVRRYAEAGSEFMVETSIEATFFGRVEKDHTHLLTVPCDEVNKINL